MPFRQGVAAFVSKKVFDYVLFIRVEAKATNVTAERTEGCNSIDKKIRRR